MQWAVKRRDATKPNNRAKAEEIVRILEGKTHANLTVPRYKNMDLR